MRIYYMVYGIFTYESRVIGSDEDPMIMFLVEHSQFIRLWEPSVVTHSPVSRTVHIFGKYQGSSK